MPLENVWERIWKESKESGQPSIIISEEESNKIYDEINAEMKDFNREFKRKNFESEREARNFLIY